ncbi:hypothetical protein BDZ89DRAFT_1050664 [Hymenopellis radicata]|nr:hypothetical protein BDZ89DRAFT_1050664 [Hymenopellis radicata]
MQPAPQRQVAGFNANLDQETIRVSVAEYRDPKPPPLEVSNLSRQAGIRLQAQLAKNLYAGLIAQAQHSHADFQERILHIQGIYESLSRLRLTEAYYRRNGYPILPLNDVYSHFHAFRDQMVMHDWCAELHALFDINWQFGEDPQAMANEHAKAQPIAEVLGRTAVERQLFGRRNDGGVRTIQKPTAPEHRFREGLANCQRHPGEFYLVRGSGCVQFTSDIQDPAYTNPLTEALAAGLVLQINKFADELQKPENAALRREVALCGLSKYDDHRTQNDPHPESASSQSISKAVCSRPPTKPVCTHIHQSPCHASEDNYRESRRPARDTIPHTSVRRDRYARSPSLSRGMKKHIQREMKEAEATGRTTEARARIGQEVFARRSASHDAVTTKPTSTPDIEYLGRKLRDGSTIPGPGKRYFGGQFVPQTRPGNGPLHDMVKKYIMGPKEGEPAGTIMGDGGKPIASTSHTRSPSYHPSSYQPSSLSRSPSSMPDLGSISESDDESQPDLFVEYDERYIDEQAWRDRTSFIFFEFFVYFLNFRALNTNSRPNRKEVPPNGDGRFLEDTPSTPTPLSKECSRPNNPSNEGAYTEGNAESNRSFPLSFLSSTMPPNPATTDADLSDAHAAASRSLPKPPPGLNAAETYLWLLGFGPRTKSLRTSLIATHPVLQHSTLLDEEDRGGRDAPVKLEEDNITVKLEGTGTARKSLTPQSNTKTTARVRASNRHGSNLWHEREILRYAKANQNGKFSRSWPELVAKCQDLWEAERTHGNLIDAPYLCSSCDPDLVVVPKKNGKVPPPPSKPDKPKDTSHCWLKPDMTVGRAVCFRCRVLNLPCSLKPGWSRSKWHVRSFFHGDDGDIDPGVSGPEDREENTKVEED